MFLELKNSSYTTILTFNEPDRVTALQPGMTPAHAADVWRTKLLGLGKRLGTPATSSYEDGGWFDQFMALVDPATVGFNCRPSLRFGCHYKVAAVQEYQALLIKLHTKYNKPIWVTELGGLAVKSRPNPQQEIDFLHDVVGMMGSLGFVERYAWYSAQADKDGANYGPAVLVNPNGSFTPVGTAYKAMDAGSLSSSTGSSTIPAALQSGAPGGLPAATPPPYDPATAAMVAAKSQPVAAPPVAAAPLPAPSPDPWSALATGLSGLVTSLQSAGSNPSDGASADQTSP